MRGEARNRLLRSLAATDRSFGRVQRDGAWYWSGRCIHCNTRLELYEDGRPFSPVTVEHLRPRNHGGDNELRNLALCCPGCNAEKGRRIDNRRKGDSRMEEVIAAALERRQGRWREEEDA